MTIGSARYILSDDEARRLQNEDLQGVIESASQNRLKWRSPPQLLFPAIPTTNPTARETMFYSFQITAL